MLIGAALALVEDHDGLGWALGAGVAGVAGSFGASYLAAQQAGAPEQAFEPVPFQGADSDETEQGQPTGGQTTEALHN